MLLFAPPPPVAAELARLVGQRTFVVGDETRYLIEDVAGEGRPLVGLVERRGEALWLVPSDADAGLPAVRLTGPLATPRIAGPRYKVWVVGDREADGALRPRRLGVLAAPTTRP